MSTWSGLSNDAALRSNVASSKSHLGDAVRQISFANSRRFCVVAVPPALGREVVLVPPLQLGLGRQRLPAGGLAADQVAADRDQAAAALGPERRQDVGGAGAPVEPGDDGPIDRRARPAARPRRPPARPARRCGRCRRTGTASTRSRAGAGRSRDGRWRPGSGRPPRRRGCRRASRAAAARRGRRPGRRRRSRRRARRRRSAPPGRRCCPARWMRARSRPTSQPAAPTGEPTAATASRITSVTDVGLRDHDHVRAVDLGDRRTRPLRHRADDVGAGGLVAGGNDGPRRQVLPGRRRRWARRTPASATGRWTAAISAACSLGEIAGERVSRLGGVDRELGRRPAVRGRVLQGDERAFEHAVLRARLDLAQPLALVGSEGGDVDQADDVVGLRRGVGDHGAAIRMADGEHRAGRLAEDGGDVGRVDLDAAKRIGGGGDLDAAPVQALDHAAPARAVGERAVHEHDGRSIGVALI